MSSGEKNERQKKPYPSYFHSHLLEPGDRNPRSPCLGKQDISIGLQSPVQFFPFQHNWFDFAGWIAYLFTQEIFGQILK